MARRGSQKRLVEWFELNEEGTRLTYVFTLEDAEHLAMPFTGQGSVGVPARSRIHGAPVRPHQCAPIHAVAMSRTSGNLNEVKVVSQESLRRGVM